MKPSKQLNIQAYARAAGVLFLVYLGIGVLLAGMARKDAVKAGQPFESTLEQLRKDRDALL